MVSFDVTSLFTNVPLDKTIKIILQQVYIDKEINANIPKNEMKELLHLCSKNVQFIFNGEIYSDRFCSYGLSYWLCSFMVELEKILIPKLNKEVKSWRLLMVPFVLLKWIN